MNANRADRLGMNANRADRLGMNANRIGRLGMSLAIGATAWGCSGNGAAPATPSRGTPLDASSGLDAGATGDIDAAATTPGGDAALEPTPGAPSDGGDAAATPTATIHFLGRFDTRDAAGPRFAWPGSAIAATFQGTGITVTLTDSGTNDFAVVVDGAAAKTVPTGGSKKTYTLASNLVAGQHTVVLTKRTESFVGVVQFLGFTVQGGALVASPEPFTRRIEIIGDSISCGYGNLGVGPTCSFSDDTEDETVAYGALAAAELDAQQTVIAYSGKGMVRDSSGATTEPMPLLFGRTLADDATSTWGFTTPAPDLVVINLSTNDFAQGDPGMVFEQAYVTFLHTLRQRYANAFVVCALSPMMSGPNRATAAGYIEAAVHAVNAGGDARVTMLELTGDGGVSADGGGAFGFDVQQASDGYGCDYHPSARTHALMAVPLVAQIRRLTGW